MRSGEYELLVFDELVYVLDYKFLDVDNVIRRDSRRPREAAASAYHPDRPKRSIQNLIEAADLVTEMKEIKHPFHAGIYAQQGIEF